MASWIWLSVVWAGGVPPAASVPPAVSAPLLQGESEKLSLTDTGRRFIQFFADGDFAKANALLHEGIALTMTPHRLEYSWAEQAYGLGAFQEIEHAIVGRFGPSPTVTVDCRWERGKRSILLNFDGQGRITGLNWMPPEEQDIAAPPPETATVTEVELTIGAAPWMLPATLTLPGDGPVRAGAVFVHDAGPADRDSTAGGTKPFLDLAMGLGARGIAVVRYEKRTAHYASRLRGKPVTITEEVITDALAALAAIRQRKELAGLPIFLLGYGLGGTLAPEIASLDGDVAGVIMLAAVARPTEDALADKFKYVAALSPGPEIQRRTDAVVEKLAALKQRKLDPSEEFLGARVAYWYDLCDRDAEVAMKKAAALPCRILILQGERDYQATTEDLKLWRSALAQHPQATYELLEDLNHVFVRGKGKGTPREYRIPKEVDGRVMKLISDWCLRSED